MFEGKLLIYFNDQSWSVGRIKPGPNRKCLLVTASERNPNAIFSEDETPVVFSEKDILSIEVGAIEIKRSDGSGDYLDVESGQIASISLTSDGGYLLSIDDAKIFFRQEEIRYIEVNAITLK